MSGALDEDTAQTLASGRQTVGSMLGAAQSHLKKVFLVFVLFLILTIWALRAFLWDRLKQDLVYKQMSEEVAEVTEIVAITPFEVILLQIKIGIVVGIVASIPVLLWYSRDALRERGFYPDSKIPRWKIAAFVVAILLLFVGGLAYGYFAFFPIMFDFLATNADQVGFKPTWSIAMWTEFILFLGLSFGVAAQLPLAMSSAARAGVVSYETFRDKWRYAVVAIFVFGAVFSPPDPFTQIMWGVPLVLLYVFSLGITKLAVLSKRAGEQVPTSDVAQKRWNQLAGVFVLSGAGMYLYLFEGGLEETNDLLAWIGSDYRFPGGGELGAFGLSSTAVGMFLTAVIALLVAAVALFYLRITELERRTEELEAEAAAAEPTEGSTADGEESEPEPEAGEPAEIDIGAMSPRAIEAAPPEAFLELSGDRALHYAEQAVENDDPEKAQAILDSFDEAQELEAEREAEDEEHEEDDEGNVVTSTAAGMLDPFTDDDTTEDDIGGYYYDIAFILDSLTSKAIWIVATFMIVLAGSFLFLYTGGIKTITDIFSSKMPEALSGQLKIVTLHPVEALIFMLKFSTLLAALSILPIVLYFAWPAVEERGVTTGDRNVLLVWGFTVLIALIGGTLLGFLYIAPGVISILAQDVITSDMVIAYRINSFGWLVIYLTVGVGVLALIPATQVLFHHGNIISYRRQRKSWRGVVIGFFAAAGFLSPSGVFTMFIVAIPASIAYGFGLGLVWLYSLVGRRTPRRHGETAD
jgi:sec-independent protein translocase protein TatC